MQNLITKFDLEAFLLFDLIIELVESEKLKIKIRKDLVEIANTHYLNIVKHNIKILFKDDTINKSKTKFKDIISSLPSFLDVDFTNSIKKLLDENILEHCSYSVVVDCLQDNLVTIDKEFIYKAISEQSISDLEFLLEQLSSDIELANIILEHLLKLKEYGIVLTKSRILSDELFERFDKIIFDTLDESEYFSFWKISKGDIMPRQYLKSYLNHESTKYLEFSQWLRMNIISAEDAQDLLLSIIDENTSIESRFEFDTLSHSIRTLLEINSSLLTYLINTNNSNILLILWHLQKTDLFDLNTLKNRFIYFRPEEQVSIFKRLFYLKHHNKINFTVDSLDEIVRSDIDLFLANEKYVDDFVLDISTHVIIECLKSYVRTGHFKFESDLILKDLWNNRKRKFQIKDYFDKCKGRSNPIYNWRTKGKISQEYYGNNQFYYAIEFETGKQVEQIGRYRNYYTFEKNPDFEHLKEEVKKISRVKWNPHKMHWGVPSARKEEVYLFAKENRFFIELADKKHITNNIHLVEYIRGDKPEGIQFCEGRKANIKHKIHNKEFWSCLGQECFENSCKKQTSEESISQDIANGENPWSNYTLLDFFNILGLDISEYNDYDHIENGKYFMLLGQINSFNRLLERLYCEECNNLIYPKNISHFALYLGTRFYCIEETCSRKDEVIYLNNCLYGECPNIIDSRVSKQCPNGLYICENCGSCCSDELYRRRLDKLQNVGGYIPESLVASVKNQKGHLEKKDYYCYKCGGKMDKFFNNGCRCTRCAVEYNFDKFKWLSKKWKYFANQNKV